jgi:hypothetical protein
LDIIEFTIKISKKKPNRISLHLQIRSVKNTFFQLGDLPFKNLLPDSLIQAIHQSGDIRSTVFTPLLILKAFIFQVFSPTGSCKEAVAHILMSGSISTVLPIQ